MLLEFISGILMGSGIGSLLCKRNYIKREFVVESVGAPTTVLPKIEQTEIAHAMEQTNVFSPRERALANRKKMLEGKI